MSDDLLDKANALMRRRNATLGAVVSTGTSGTTATAIAAPLPAQPAPAPEIPQFAGPLPQTALSTENSDEDFPVLTEVVDSPEVEGPSLPGRVALQSTDIASQIEAAVRERLDHLLKEQQAQLSQEIETWLNIQMPQLVSRAMDGINDHLVTMVAHRVRDELLPRLREIAPTGNKTTPDKTDS